MLAFERLDTHLFKAFLSAAETQHFTLAAQASGMTQSGISQHIAKLEEQLGVPLFERVNKKVLLTPEGEELKRFIETISDQLDSFVEKVSKQRAELTGIVKYAMPASCLKTPHFPILLEKRLKFSKVELKVDISSNDEIFEKLISGLIDFGFVTKSSENPAINHQLFAEEEYILVGKDKALVNEISAKNLGEIPFVYYPGMDALLEHWCNHYFPQKRAFSARSLKRMGEINHLDGAITMVLHGVGCSVFPKHCVDEHIRSRVLTPFKVPQRHDPIGKIHVVTRANQVPPLRVQKVMDAFWEMKKGQ